MWLFGREWKSKKDDTEIPTGFVSRKEETKSVKKCGRPYQECGGMKIIRKQHHPIPRLQGDQPFRGALREEQRKDRRRDNQSRSDSFTAVCRAYGSFCGGYLLYTVVASGICSFYVVYC